MLPDIREIKDHGESRVTMVSQVKMEVLEEKELWDHQETKESQEQQVQTEGLEEWVDLADREVQDLWDQLDTQVLEVLLDRWVSKVHKGIQVLLVNKVFLVD